MTLAGWPQICTRDSYFMEDTKSVTRINQQDKKLSSKKIDMADTIYTVVSSVLHKNNSYLY